MCADSSDVHFRMEYLQGPDLWHMVEAGERNAGDVVVVEGAIEKRKEAQSFTLV